MALLELSIQMAIAVSVISASKLSLTANSKVVIEYIQPLILNCTFEATEADGDDGNKPHFMYLSHDSEGVIASVSEAHSLTINGENRYIRADGKLGDERSNDSFLQVTWKRPSYKQAAAYTCVAHTKNSEGKDKIFTSKLKAKVEKPVFEDWVEFVGEVDDRVEESAKKFKEAIDAVKAKVVEQERALQALASALASSAPRVEEGTISCGSSDEFYGNDRDWKVDAKERDVDVVFKVPFTSPPSVIFGFKYVDIDGRFATRFYHKLRKVTNTGFTFVCGTWSDSRIIEEDLFWYAIKK